MSVSNIDHTTVDSFADEWSRFDQTGMTAEEARAIFARYFEVFDWSLLPPDAEGFDMGCGSGRWAAFVAPRVGRLHCIDPARGALAVARRRMASADNVNFIEADVGAAALKPASQDFGYSLGVLHHIPDTQRALSDCVALLKPGAPFLVYLYYRFDNRPAWFKAIWRVSNTLRGVISALPPTAKNLTTGAIAGGVYWPLARAAWVAEKVGVPVKGIPLSFYRAKSFYTMRTDSRDRFGTPLERRFTRAEIAEMMVNAGLRNVKFLDGEPFWVASGIRT